MQSIREWVARMNRDGSRHTTRLKRYAQSAAVASQGLGLARKYSEFTMIPVETYVANMLLLSSYRDVPGCVVECGVWRGGMIAGLAEFLGTDRNYYLCDSFEGLPPAKPIDGAFALAWQSNTQNPRYHDNCKAEPEFAESAMKLSGAPNYELVKGWFSDTLPTFKPAQPIAILRIDADWYDSVMCCLRYLVPYLAPGGVVIIDDYFTFEGCAKAVHEYLATSKSSARLYTPYRSVCAIEGLAQA